jgi:hypothetical protein
MFRVELFVQDPKLAMLLRAVAGIATGEPKVQPCVNAKEKGGKVVPALSGDLCELFSEFAKKRKLTEFKAVHVKEFVSTIGRDPSSTGYYIKQLFEKGCFKKKGKGANMSYVLSVKK